MDHIRGAKLDQKFLNGQPFTSSMDKVGLKYLKPVALSERRCFSFEHRGPALKYPKPDNVSNKIK